MCVFVFKVALSFIQISVQSKSSQPEMMNTVMFSPLMLYSNKYGCMHSNPGQAPNLSLGCWENNIKESTFEISLRASANWHQLIVLAD